MPNSRERAQRTQKERMKNKAQNEEDGRLRIEDGGWRDIEHRNGGREINTCMVLSDVNTR
ncbi:MAG: hypothetical protein JWQ71_3830 [Pedosphaera sp.]|nr:hypothetical protein [Pedosphaera sp.]